MARLLDSTPMATMLIMVSCGGRETGERQRREGEDIVKRILIGAMMLALLTPTSALAQSAFDGTWKVDFSSGHLPKRPDVYLLKDGMWSCKSCIPPVSVKADATDQPVTGHPYYDSVAIKMVDDRIVQETQKKNGTVFLTARRTVSRDGKTLTTEASYSAEPGSPPATGKIVKTRVGAAPAGAHAVSGSWRATGYADMSDNQTTVTYKMD